MDLATAERLAAATDPKAVSALQKRSTDPAVAKAVAAQFGTLLMQRVMQNGGGQAIAMTGGPGGNVVNSMFASTMAQAAMSGDQLGLANLLLHSMTAKQQAASGGAATAPATTEAAAATAPAASATAPAPRGFTLAPYWQGNGMRPLGGAMVHAALEARGSPVAGIIAAPKLGAAASVLSNAAMGNSGGKAAVPAAAPSVSTPSSMSTSSGASPGDIESFTQRLQPLLKRAARQLGVSPRVLLAQAALETGWGRSVVGNNVFGIKAGSSWSGARVSAPTHEIVGGKAVAETAAFRSYPSLDAAVEDYVSLVAGGHRYQAAVGAGNDARGYGEALVAAGYATDGDYPRKLAAVAASPSVSAAFAAAAPPAQPHLLAAS